MIRTITKEEVFEKRTNAMVTFVEVDRDSASYMKAHIVRAVFLPSDRIAALARHYLPDLSAEIVLYTRNTGPDDPAVLGLRTLHRLGYENLYYLTGGKQAWLNGGYPFEAIHFPPPEPEPEPQPAWILAPAGKPAA